MDNVVNQLSSLSQKYIYDPKTKRIFPQSTYYPDVREEYRKSGGVERDIKKFGSMDMAMSVANPAPIARGLAKTIAKTAPTGMVDELASFTDYVANVKNKAIKPDFDYESMVRDMIANFKMNPNKSNPKLASDFADVLAEGDRIWSKPINVVKSGGKLMAKPTQPTKGGDLLAEARKYKSAEEFIDANTFRDAHAAPSFDPTPVKERMESGGDFSLSEVIKGQHNQPADYFDPRVGPRYYMYNNQAGMESLTAIGNVKRGAKTITAYRVVPKEIKTDKLIDRDWISFSEKYAIDHGESRFGKGEYKIIKQEVSPKDVWWDGNDIREWGYDTGKTQTKSRNELAKIFLEAHRPTQPTKLPTGVMGFAPHPTY